MTLLNYCLSLPKLDKSFYLVSSSEPLGLKAPLTNPFLEFREEEDIEEDGMAKLSPVRYPGVLKGFPSFFSISYSIGF